MIDAEILRLASHLVHPADRAGAARVLAAQLGGEALLVFVRDPEIGVLLPAPGFLQTLSDGRAWRTFLAGCLEAGHATGMLRLCADAEPLPALGLAAGADAVFVLLGAAAVSAPEALSSVQLVLPMLTAAFRGERQAAIASAQARLARDAADQAVTLTRTLDAFRGVLQEALQRAETSQAELASANDRLRDQAAELEAANEQLQAQAEELETQTEALQSTTKELQQQAAAREAAAQILAASEAHLRFTTETLQLGTWDLDLRTGTAARSLRHDRIFGYGELLPTWTYDRFLAHIHPDDRVQVDQAFRDALENGTDWDFRCRIHRADDAERWIWARGEPYELAEDGRAIRMLGGVLDITDQVARAEELKASEVRYRSLVEATTQVVWACDPEGRITTEQPSWAAYSGQRFDEYRNFGWTEAIHPDDRASLLAAWHAAVATRHFPGTEARIGRHDGVYRLFWIRGVPIFTPGGELREWVGTCTDITERERAERQLRQAQKLQAVGTLAGGVAHEVNNQMTAVLGFGEFVLHALGPGHPQAADVREMVKAAERSAKVTQQLLAFSRRQITQPRVLDLHAVVEALRPVLTRLLGADKTLEVPPSRTRRRVNADPTQLEQVLINLAANARDAMPGGGRLTITLEGVELDTAYARTHGGVHLVPGPYVLLAVSDTGTGMDRETLAQVFEPFFTTKPVGQGTGLGLAMVYGIVKQHGGFIWAYSELGSGTTMKIYLPAAPAEATPDGVAIRAESGGVAEAAGSTILLVEDEPVVRTLARRALEAAGYAVVDAEHGREALEVVDGLRDRPDLVVTDVVMPELGGRELSDALRRRHPDLPVLYMSGYTGDDVVLRGLIPDGAPFLQKPFTPDALVDQVQRLLAR